ncbi:MAG: hypothetical protein ABL308_02425 [Oceanicaulis sp.]
MKTLIKAGASLAVLAFAGAASAQDFEGAPSYGVLDYSGEAVSLDIRAAGALPLSRLSSGCAGYGAGQPTAVLSVSRAGQVYLAAGSDEDLTLAVRAPDGTVTCDDDSAGGMNPGVVLDAQPGDYEIWVGSYQAGVGYPLSVLHASPGGFVTDNPYIVSADPDAPADQSVRLSGGFGNDPRSFEATAGGPARLEPLGGDSAWCSGYAGAAPDLAIDYRGGDLPLHLLVESEEDSTIAVVTPSGDVLCNDDMIGLDAGVRIEAPERGRYAVFAGLLHDDSGEAPATISVSEIGYGGIDRRLDVAGEPRFGVHALSAGFSPDPAAFEVQAGGPIEADMALSEDMTGGAWCPGNVTREPTLRFEYDGEGAPLFFSVTGDEDVTLLVNGPDGSWMCDDDSLGALDAFVTFEAAQPGVYDLYAGAFSEEPVAAQVFVSGEGPGPEPEARQIDLTAPAAFEAALAPGFDPADGVFAVEAGGVAEVQYTDPSVYDCPGVYPSAPSLALDWAGGDLSVSVLVPEGDATLAIALPGGGWACDDDGAGDLNSRVVLPGAEAGVYAVFAGTFFGGTAEGEIVVTEDVAEN